MLDSEFEERLSLARPCYGAYRYLAGACGNKPQTARVTSLGLPFPKMPSVHFSCSALIYLKPKAQMHETMCYICPLAIFVRQKGRYPKLIRVEALKHIKQSTIAEKSFI